MALAVLALVALHLPGSPVPVVLSGKFTVDKKLLSPTGREVAADSKLIDVLFKQQSAAQVCPCAIIPGTLASGPAPTLLPACSPLVCVLAMTAG